ncbi:hypothetical protein [Nocardia stercoris]|uniref:hypothetical protein n=1 Tax=Nocardia stercoris TaxID=2483361 RepID=UPI0011C3AC73|nr:hypothetical protein [Nocardia stercoris]
MEVATTAAADGSSSGSPYTPVDLAPGVQCNYALQCTNDNDQPYVIHATAQCPPQDPRTLPPLVSAAPMPPKIPFSVVADPHTTVALKTPTLWPCFAKIVPVDAEEVQEQPQDAPTPLLIPSN